MRRIVISLLALALLVGGGVLAHGVASADGNRADCPGKIECPLTGDSICRDRCPLQMDGEAGLQVSGCCRRPR